MIQLPMLQGTKSFTMFFIREEKSEVLAECKEELEHANSLVTKLKAEVICKIL